MSKSSDREREMAMLSGCGSFSAWTCSPTGSSRSLPLNSRSLSLSHSSPRFNHSRSNSSPQIPAFVYNVRRLRSTLPPLELGPRRFDVLPRNWLSGLPAPLGEHFHNSPPSRRSGLDTTSPPESISPYSVVLAPYLPSPKLPSSPPATTTTSPTQASPQHSPSIQALSYPRRPSITRQSSDESSTRGSSFVSSRGGSHWTDFEDEDISLSRKSSLATEDEDIIFPLKDNSVASSSIPLRSPRDVYPSSTSAAAALVEAAEALAQLPGKIRRRRRKASEDPRDLHLRKLACQFCGKLFARPSALKTHRRSHSKEMPFICPEPTCARLFAVRSNLRRHQRLRDHKSKEASECDPLELLDDHDLDAEGETEDHQENIAALPWTEQLLKLQLQPSFWEHGVRGQ